MIEGLLLNLSAENLNVEEENRRSGRLADSLLICGAIFLIILQVMWLEEPWDGSHAGFNSGTFCGYSCRGFQRHGYFEVGGIPSVTHHAGDGDYYTRYINHPPTLYLLLYPCHLYLGQDEAAINIAMLVVLVFGLVLMRLSLGSVLGRSTAAYGTLIFASLPIIVQFTRMADPIIFCLPFLVPTVCLWFRHMAGQSKSSYAAYFAMSFVAGMMDWHVYFLVLGCWADLLFRRQRRWRDFVLVGLPFGLALCTSLAWIILTSPNSLHELNATLSMAGKAVGGGLKTYGPSAIPNQDEVLKYWAMRIGRHFDQLLTIPVLLAAGLGFLLVIGRAKKNPIQLRFICVLLIAGVMPFVAAHEHAFVHEFWPIMLAPAIAILIAIVISRLEAVEANSKPRRVLALVLLLGIVSYGFYRGISYHDGMRRTHPRDVMVDLNERFGPKDVVLSAAGYTPQRYYANFTIFSNVYHPELFRLAMEELYPARDQFDRLFLYWPASAKYDYRWMEEGAATGLYPVKFARRAVVDGVDSVLVEFDLKKAFASFQPR